MPKESRPAKPDTTIKGWHKRLASITGTLSLNIEHRHLSRGELLAWANELSDVADEMRALAKK